MINPLAKIGEKTILWARELSNIGNCEIGKECTIHSHVWIADGVKIGDRVKIQAFAFIPRGVTIEDDAFIGPHVCFTNDLYPPSDGSQWQPILVKKFAAIGANSTILPGVTIGVSAVVGAGSVVTESVDDHAIVINTAAVVVNDLTYTGSVKARRRGTKK